MFSCNRECPDLYPTIAALCTRIKNNMLKSKLVLSADDLNVIKWYIGVAFALNADFKSHTGGITTYGRELLISQ